MIYLIYFTLIIFILLDYIFDKKLVAPAKIFNLVWLFTLFFYNFKLSYLQQELLPKTLKIFLASIVIFNLICLLFRIFSKKEFKTIKIYNPSLSVNKRINIAFWIFVIVFIGECYYCEGFPLLFLINTGKSYYMNFGIPSLHGALNGIAMVLGAYFLFKKDKRKYIIFLYGILTLSRQVIMSLVIEGVFFNIEYLKTFKIRKYIPLALISILMFNLIGNFRSGSNTMTSIFEPKPEYSKLSSTTMWFYSYTTFSVSNFNNLVSITSGNLNHGSTTLKYFLPTILLNKFNIKDKYKVRYLVKSNFTVSTSFSEIYIDFGTKGILIFILVIAFIGNKIYRNVLYKPDDESMLLYSVFLHNILFLFFNNMFLYIPVFSQFIYIILIFRKGKIKNGY